jgi:quercetin dioxygenase-like cupin family protein
MNTEPREFADGAEQGIDESEVTRLICEGLLPLELPAADRAGLRGRLLRRIAESARRHAQLITVRAGDGNWRAVKTGIRAKTLWEGPRGSSVLIEFAPGATLPVHRHQQLEEGIVLHGSLRLGELELGPGDYHVSPAGSRHGRISSPVGGLAYLRGTALGSRTAILRELLGGLKPGGGPAVQTVFAGDDGWQPIADGAEQKILWREGDMLSYFLRLAAGGHLPAHGHDADEECIMLNGDAFFGDVLVQAGEFHLAPAGSEHGEVTSDDGALAFMRGRAVLPLAGKR